MIGEILRHALGEGGHQHPLVPLRPHADLLHQIVDLAVHRSHLHPRIQQTRRPDHLLHDLVGAVLFVVPRRGGHKHCLPEPLLELLKFQRPVVKGAGQPEPVVHQALFSGAVAVIHGSHLRQRHMALVHKQHKVLRKIVQQRHGRRSRLPSGDDPAVILNARAVAQLPHHLHVVAGALVNALRLNELAAIFKILLPLRQFFFNFLRSPRHFLLGGHIVAGGVNSHVVYDALRLSRHGIKLADAIHFVPEILHPNGVPVGVHGVYLHRVPPHPKHIAFKGDVVPLIADLHQLSQQLLSGIFLPLPQGNDHVGVVDGVAQPVNTRNRCHHDHVPPLKECRRGAVAQPLDLRVDGRVFFNKSVRVGDIRLRLIIVVVRHEVFHCVFRKKLPKLLA